MRPRRFLPRAAFDLPSDSRDAFGRGHDRLLAATRSRFDLREPVGDRQPILPDDVTTVERLLNRVGQPPFDGDREPTGFFSVPLRDSIRTFQRRNRLRDDGVVNPDGETLKTLRREIGFNEDESRFDGAGDSIKDPDGPTRIGLRCRQIAVRLENRSADLGSHRAADRGCGAGDRVRSAEVQLPMAIASGIASVAGALAARNLPLAVAEAFVLAVKLANANTSVNVESGAVNAAASRLGISLDERDTIKSKLARLEAERGRLGCSLYQSLTRMGGK